MERKRRKSKSVGALIIKWSNTGVTEREKRKWGRKYIF